MIMFTFSGFLVLALGAIPLIHTLAVRNRLDEQAAKRRMRRGIVVFALTIGLIVVLNVLKTYYTELLWFRSVGFGDRYWTELLTKIALFAVGAVIAFVVTYVVWRVVATRLMGSQAGVVPLLVCVVAAVIMGSFASALWEAYLSFIEGATTEVSDPILGVKTGFYLFSLPFLGGVVAWAMGLTGLALGEAVVLISWSKMNVGAGEAGTVRRLLGFRSLFFLLVAVFALLLALNSVLGIFRLLYSQGGVVAGAGWIDANVRIVTRSISAGIFVVTAVLLVGSGLSARFARALFGITEKGPSGRTAIAPAVVIGALLVVGSIAPAAIDAVVVRPNEISKEQPYIEHSIEFTSRAFDLQENGIERRQFEVGRNISQDVLDENESTLDNIRLWDSRALKDNLQEQQEIRLYYSFGDVDIDRYNIDGEYRQVMLAVREMDKSRLAAPSQTWVSRRLKYTHGYGIVMTPVHELLDDGRPKLLIRNIPAEVRVDTLSVERPEIYFGELTTDYVYVKTSEREFDYPSSDENVYTTYEGDAGVVLDSFFKRFLFAWRFNDYQLLFSTYFDRESRILFNRQIHARVAKLAPFLAYDRDPYPVVTDDGHVVFMIDAYTIAATYPYSERYTGSYTEFVGANYIRNSVKIVVDAYDGSVDFYTVDPQDPVIRTYDNMFPGLIRPFEEMPADIRRHMRYPVGLLTAQAEVYSTYHMRDPEVFYQREDVWEFATERYRDDFQRVEPYYVLTEFPDGGRLEFLNILPFTPKHKNVINAWIAGRSDMPEYGNLLVFTYPKGIEVLGPRQIEARIDQNTEMSRALSLWGQRGSRVIRGNLLAIPLFNRQEMYLLFVEPIFLQAENASLPELKRVAIADQDRVVWSEEFDTSLDLLTRRAEGEKPAPVSTAGPAAAAAPAELSQLASRAASVYGEVQSRLEEGRYSDAGASMEELESIVDRIRELIGSTGDEGAGGEASPTGAGADTATPGGSTGARADEGAEE